MNKGALWNWIQKTSNVKIEHPVHFSRQQSRVQRIQRLVLASSWPEPVREAEKIRFVNGVHTSTAHAGRSCLPAPSLQAVFAASG